MASAAKGKRNFSVSQDTRASFGKKRRRRFSGSESEDSRGPFSSASGNLRLSDPSMSKIYNSSFKNNKPAELFRKDLISAMKLPDSEQLAPEEYWLISDSWKQDWEKGVQVPVNPENLAESAVRVIRKKEKKHNFKLPKKLIRCSHDQFFSNDLHVLTNVATQAEKVCRYDLDDIDVQWLKRVNEELEELGQPQIEEQMVEYLIEDLETQCFENLQGAIKSEEGLGIEYDEDVICDVCRSPDSEEGNEMVFCDSCNICVHQACYGITNIPEGSWVCRTCALGLRPSCLLCPDKGGAMKTTRSGRKWAHVSCALWIPEVSIGNVDKMEPIIKISDISPRRWSLVCSLCRERVGACIQCSVKTCKTAYHVTCAFKNNLDMKAIIEDEKDDDGVKLRSYCQKHSQKKDSNLSSDSEDENESPRKKKKNEKNQKPKKEYEISCEEQAKAKKIQQMSSEFYNYVNTEEMAELLQVNPTVVDFVYQYWKLKRKAQFDKPLLTPKEEESDILGRKQEDSLYARMKMFVHLRQDLERVRNLCYMVSRREKLFRSWLKLREEIFQTQAKTLANKSLKLTNQDIEAVMLANRGSSVYDKIYSRDRELAPHTLAVLAKLNPVEYTYVEKVEKKKKEKPSFQRLPNPYAKQYINGTHARSKRRLSSVLNGSKNLEKSSESAFFASKMQDDMKMDMDATYQSVDFKELPETSEVKMATVDTSLFVDKSFSLSSESIKVSGENACRGLGDDLELKICKKKLCCDLVEGNDEKESDDMLNMNNNKKCGGETELEDKECNGEVEVNIGEKKLDGEPEVTCIKKHLDCGVEMKINKEINDEIKVDKKEFGGGTEVVIEKDTVSEPVVKVSKRGLAGETEVETSKGELCDKTEVKADKKELGNGAEVKVGKEELGNEAAVMTSKGELNGQKEVKVNKGEFYSEAKVKATKGELDSKAKVKAGKEELSSEAKVNASKLELDSKAKVNASKGELDSEAKVKATKGELDSEAKVKASKGDLSNEANVKASKGELSNEANVKASKGELSNEANVKANKEELSSEAKVMTRIGELSSEAKVKASKGELVSEAKVMTSIGELSSEAKIKASKGELGSGVNVKASKEELGNEANVKVSNGEFESEAVMKGSRKKFTSGAGAKVSVRESVNIPQKEVSLNKSDGKSEVLATTKQSGGDVEPCSMENKSETLASNTNIEGLGERERVSKSVSELGSFKVNHVGKLVDDLPVIENIKDTKSDIGNVKYINRSFSSDMLKEVDVTLERTDQFLKTPPPLSKGPEKSLLGLTNSQKSPVLSKTSKRDDKLLIHKQSSLDNSSSNERLREESTKICESIFVNSTASKGSLSGYRIPKKSKSGNKNTTSENVRGNSPISPLSEVSSLKRETFSASDGYKKFRTSRNWKNSREFNSHSVLLNGENQSQSKRLVIKLRKDPNFPDSHRWKRDPTFGEGAGAFKVVQNDWQSPPKKTDHNLRSDRRIQLSDPTWVASKDCGSKENGTNSRYSMRFRTNSNMCKPDTGVS
ncbi:uncharacterized protein LOC106470609 isoform X2 [Limulus polyphemus]|uniref:Uncharacterized protein LOC106470609 isoform X2 n=1 Tax=Limulus polyphemus TaxID=6850 RepID=A0ABM1TGD7_LIMPO|nr:uncharacterized protein LOC106470609 isoform X2 [Limulus polyphemus]